MLTFYPEINVNKLLEFVRPYWMIVKRWKRRLDLALTCTRIAPGGGVARFQCNICGTNVHFPRHEMRRETISCWYCGSTVRWRSVVHALSMHLFGESLVIADFPERPNLVGVGLSDWSGYASRLAKKLGYTNSFYHMAPFLDITDVEKADYGKYDFIISSEVFEHLCPPISKAFKNAYELLKPGGTMIFTVPYVSGETKEHFPEVRQFSLEQERGEWVMFGRNGEGQTQKFTNLKFHGGPGTVLEFRVFGDASIKQDCEMAGFGRVEILAEPVEKYGIFLNSSISDTVPNGTLGTMDSPPWLLTRPMNEGTEHEVRVGG